jgi:predicted dehydrogenase
MGQYDLGDFLDHDHVRCVALCDVDTARFGDDQAMKHVNEKKSGDPKPKLIQDYRKVLEMKEVDAVIVATPDHWHCLPVIEAFAAGKDVYHEKPVALTIAEGRLMANTARQYDRISQVGTQQRSGEEFQQAVEIVHSGKLGTITTCGVWTRNNLTPRGIGNPMDGDPPSTVDYDRWLGPAPKRPFNKNRFHGSFRWFWDYSGGKITDWGVHLIDVIHWAMETDAPLSATASGGNYVLNDNRETPDTQDVLYDYPPSPHAPRGFTLQWSHRNSNTFWLNRPGDLNKGAHCMAFFGSEATLLLDRGGFRVIPQTKRDGDKDTDRVTADEYKGESRFSDRHRAHVADFLECVKSRQLCRSDVEIAHRSTVPPHLGNIALWTGRKIRWDAYREQIIGDDDAARHLIRPYRAPWKLPDIEMGRPMA